MIVDGIEYWGDIGANMHEAPEVESLPLSPGERLSSDAYPGNSVAFPPVGFLLVGSLVEGWRIASEQGQRIANLLRRLPGVLLRR